jgi:predicted aldo/keto reductase-like oxidoreductase
VQDNIYSIKEAKPLTEEEQAMLRRAAALINAQKTVPCTGCSYCKEHCPKNIDIPRIFTLYNGARQDPPEPEAKIQYQSLETAAVDCIGCARCEKLCPQHLPIIELLREAVEKFEN